MEQYSSSQVSSEQAIENEDSNIDEEPDLRPTAADAHKALHRLKMLLANRCDEPELYSQYYCFARNIEHLIAPCKQTGIYCFSKNQ